MSGATFKFAAALLFAMVALSARALPLGQGETLAEQQVNTMCPIQPDEPVVAKYNVEYDGQIIGLCCIKCKRKFLKDPVKWIAMVEGYVPSGNAPTELVAMADEAVTEPLGFVASVGRFHPLAVHLPIGLFMAGALAELMFLLGLGGVSRKTVQFCWYLATAGAAAAAVLGLAALTDIAETNFLYPDAILHRNAGIATLLFAVIASSLLNSASKQNATDKEQMLWRGAMLLTVASVGLAGHLGSILVFGADHLPF